MTDLRLAVPAATSWAAVAATLSWPAALWPLAAGSWGSAVLLAAVLLWRHRASAASAIVAPMVLLSLAATGLVLTSAAVASAQRHPPVLAEAAAAGRFVMLTATVTDTVPAGQGSFSITVDSVSVGGALTPVQVPARYFGVPVPVALGIGARLSMRGTVAPTDPADATALLVFGSEAPQVTGAPPAGLDWANSLRATFRETAAQLPSDGGALLPGLAIGDTSRVSAELDAAMKTSALSHLTAVSGANCAIVVGLAIYLAASAGLGRRGRLLVAGAALIGFVVLVTPEPSVLRAGVMAALVLLVLGGGRPARGVPILAAAVIGLLTADPFLARTFGFVLSVFATAGLLLLTRPLSRLFSRWVPQPIAVVMAVPLAAQLACQPVIILLSPTLPTYGVIANILAEPAAPLATVLGLIACLLGPIAPGPATLVAALAWVPSAWIAAVATFCAGLPGASIPWLEGGLGVVSLAVVTGLAVVAVLGGGASAVRRWRRVAASAVAIIVAAYLGGIAGTAVHQGLTRPVNWQFAQCDVGQGDAVLVRSGTQIALIDAGEDPVLLRRCLAALDIRRINLLVLTHFDLDHVGGTSAVLGMVDTVLVGPSGGADDDELQRRVRESGARVLQAARGDTGRLGSLGWRVLWPAIPLRGVETGNPASIVVRFDPIGGTAGLSGIFLGDLGLESQLRLLALEGGDLPAVDVVKVAHHGSADQYPGMYDALEARVGLIGVGAENTYGHPTRLLLDVLATKRTRPVRSDESGLVLISPLDAGGITIWQERPTGGAVDGDKLDTVVDGTAAKGPQWQAGQQRERRRRPRWPSRNSRGTASGRRRSCSSRAPRAISPTGPSAFCGTC